MFTKEMLPETITVPLTFPIYKDSEGKPITFIFKFHLETGEISEKHNQFSTVQQRTAEELNLDRFSLLLAERPEGFDDFPMTSGEFQEKCRQQISQADIPAGTQTTEVAAKWGIAISDVSLYERAKTYFADPRLTHVVTEALIAYNRAIRPEELFR